MIYAALINPYPFPAADRIVRMSVQHQERQPRTVNLNGPQIRQLRQVHAIESMLAMDYHAMTMTGHDFPENVNVIGLISNGFDDLGVPALLGRGIVRSDAIDGQEPQPVAVLSYKFWQKHSFRGPAGGRKDAAARPQELHDRRRGGAALHLVQRRRLPAAEADAGPGSRCASSISV